ncbi:hypothetical protein BCR33DRAFT_715588 [Rhizoclosmatium globosum]|uniref:Uncharacterized protein n=1 Tax=Rhizoclosmatium globosum TaxID=329046 RepID=A0A1Y2CHW9_9FUNG|nr:hypothetical protein BCR33DRAFT_715588 [Rhizoclosmatium globosum]|eukprot:ORY46536.1 hypothetical protein BCR33DRAFT_715588 [Rhizoclosmatium globosum]
MTAEFTAFRREVYHKAQSLELVLYHQKEIVELIIKYLEIPKSGAAEPLLKVLPYFPSVLKSILTLIHKSDAKLLEAIFNSIAYLFKYLSREVSEDVLPTFQIFQTVMQDHRHYIRQFGAEAFGFIIRKIQGEKLTALFKYMIKSLHRNPSWTYSEGVAILMFETLKQVRHTLHSRAISMIRQYTNLILSSCPSSDDIAFTTLLKTMTALGHHITPETSEELWDYLHESVEASVSLIHSEPTPENTEKFSTLVLLRKGARITDRKKVFELVDSCLVGFSGNKAILEQEAIVMPLVRCLAGLVAFSNLEDILVQGKASILSLFNTNNPIYIFSFCEMLHRLKSDHLAIIVMPYLINFLPTAWKSYSTMSVLYLSDMMMDAHFETKLPYISHELKTVDGCLKLPKQMVKDYSANLDKLLSVKGLNWEKEISTLVSGDLSHPSKLASMAVAITSTQLISLPFSEYFSRLETLFRALLKSGKGVQGKTEAEFGTISRSACVAVLTTRALGSLIRRCTRAKNVDQLSTLFDDVVLGEYLELYAENDGVLETVGDFIEAIIGDDGNEEDNIKASKKLVSVGLDQYERVLVHLAENVGSVNPAVRLHSLRIIMGLSKLVKGQDVQIFQIALECERIEDSLDSHREKSMLVKRMDNLILAKLPRFYCLALLSSPFSLLHADASTVLLNLAKRSSDLFWKFYLPILLKTKQQAHKQVDFELNFPELPQVNQVDKKADTTCTTINRVENLSRQVTTKFHHLPEYERRAFFKSAKDSINRLEDMHYYVVLLKLLRSLPNLVEQKSAQILPLYFELLKDSDEAEDTEDQDDVEDEKQAAKSDMNISSIRGVVVEFLHVFENLRHPGNMSEAERLYNSFLDLLTNGDAKLQQSAISCILTWKEPGIVSYAEQLKGLADDAKFRDFLSTLDVEELRNNVKLEHQPSLLQALMRILYGKLISRRGRGSTKVGLKARRNAIFAFTVSLEDQDREFLIDLMVTPFKFALKHDHFNSDGVFEFKKSLSLSGSMGPLKYQLGFMNIIEDSIKQLKNHISPALPRILTVILNLMNAAELELVEKASAEEVDIDVLRMKQLKDIRQMCILRLAQLFNSIDNFDFSPYVPAIFESIIDNRIPKFDSEHTQASSSLMDLMVAWSRKAKYTDYFTQRAELIPKILGVLSAKNVKEAVSSVIVGILESFLALDKEATTNEIAIKLIKPNMAFVLKNFEVLLSKLLLHANVRLNTVNLTSRVISVLAQTSQFVNSPRSSRLTFFNFGNFIPVLPSLQTPETRMDAPYFLLISQMFSTLEERASRLKANGTIVTLVENFNAYLSRRIEEPDFNRRFDAFSEVGQTLYKSLDADQWLPVLHTFVCPNSLLSLLEMQQTLTRANTELVRNEFMTLLGVMVKNFNTMDEFKDMVVLLADGDDEAAFFSNIYHMQIHRRIRAMKRLADISLNGSISQSNVSNIFLPLITHVIFENDRQSDFSIISESINTIAALSACLSWGKYYDLIKRFLKAISKRPTLEKELIRVIVAVLENFKFKIVPDSFVPVEEAEVVAAEAETVEGAEGETSAMDVDSDNDDDEMDVDVPVEKEKENLEQMQRIHTTVVKKLIPDLFAVPVAVAITKLLMRLPEESKNLELPNYVRDGSRDALLKIAKELGPVYFPFIIKELQSALLRGYQLHVLGFTVHHCWLTSVDMLARIFVNDIFGTLEMNGKLKEMKRSKSFDSFELVAKVVKLTKITSLLNPLKELMLESNSSKMSLKIQDILRRIVSGLSVNSSLNEADMLVFIHGLITENLPLSKLEAYSKNKQTAQEKRITVQMRRNEPLDNMLNYFKANAYMFIDFGLALLLVYMKKDLVRQNNPDHLKMMDPLVPVLSKSMYSQHSSVVVNSLKIFTLLVKWPLPNLEISVPAVMKRIFELFLKKGDINAERSDAALKLLSMVIKECAYVDITQKQIVSLIQFLTPELEEPDKQSAAFSLIRSILNRKYIFPEIYDLMAVVTKIMVTSQGGQVRELCRQSYCHFLLEYPHGPVKLRKEFNYLIQNLSYEFESGRESVLAFFGLCLPKLSETVLNEYAEMILLSFAKCREKASDMIKLLVRQVHAAKRDNFFILVEGWFGKSDQPQLLRTGSQLVGLFRMTPKLISVLDAVKADYETRLEFWQCGYYTLNTFSKIFAKQPSLVLDSSCLPLWQHVKFFLLYPHTWVRLISCRLFGSLFAAIDLEEVDADNETVQSILLDAKTLSLISMQLTKQLESELLQEEHAKQIAIMQFHDSGDEEDEAAGDVEEEDEEDNEEEGEAAAETKEKEAGNVLLLKIFKRLAYVGRAHVGTDKVLLRKSVFQWFGAMLLSLEADDYKPYLTPAMSVLYRTMNSSGRETDEIKSFAKEISEHLQKAVGITEYLSVYNKIHSQVQQSREERKRSERSRLLWIRSGCQRRVQKNMMKKAGKKRKIEEFTKGRVKYENTKKLRKK